MDSGYRQDLSASRRSEFWAGAKGIFPLVVGAIPFGLIYGTLVASSGLSFGAAMAMSAFVFAGSSQFIAVGLVAAGTAVPLIILTTFVVNLRHLLYAASLVPHVQHLPQAWKMPIGFWLTDEAFAVAIARYNHTDCSPHKHWYYLGAATFMYANWQVCTFLGLTIGQMIPNAASWGLDFAMSVTFIGMVIPYLKTKPMYCSVIVAGIVALLAHGLPHQLGLMVAAIAGIAAGLISEQQLTEKRNG
ncbi:AzlC family ABC transporter permease [Phormidium tenue FACHB-886]|nr:AzlC family ABC transporter permease [Phormidium tenue FACHB-886]